MRRIIVTPAGRKKYLEILHKYLVRDYNYGHFKEWHLWINTINREDIDYIKTLSEKYEFIKLVYSKIPVNGIISIGHFFEDYVDADTVYLRLDDDIVWIEQNAINDLFNYRIENPQYFLVFGNIINNSICGHIHQRFGINSYDYGFNKYLCMDFVGWQLPEYSQHVHEVFLKKIWNGMLDDYRFKQWDLLEFERFSINVISWLGSEFKKFDGKVGLDEEQWLSADKPKNINKICSIYGRKLFSHFAFHTQREYLESNTILLDLYRNIAP
jgi:hypothetical protein